jgi:putative addiction module killer protein
MDIQRYIDSAGKEPVTEWQKSLRDQTAKVAFARRLTRLQAGNFGDHKFCRQGVWELKIDVGAGYRVYYGKEGDQMVLLLCAGDKRTQDRDIDTACNYWQEWKQELKNGQ